MSPVESGPRDRHAVAMTVDSTLNDFMISAVNNGKVAAFDNTAVIDELDPRHVHAQFLLTGQ